VSDNNPIPSIILHIPHASRYIPRDVRADILLSDDELEAELDRLDELFSVSHPSVATLLYPVSRYVVDPERFDDDEQEPMAARGQGVIYTKTTAGGMLRKELSMVRREALLDRYYRPHHDALSSLAGPMEKR